MISTLKLAGLAFGAALLAASPALAAGDAAQGKTLFKGICAMCHNDTKGAGNKIGPNLWGIVGSKAGTTPGFNFSAAMKNSGITWTEDKLAAYIDNPQKAVPGNRMPYAGEHNTQKAQDVTAYLATLK